MDNDTYHFNTQLIEEYTRGGGRIIVKVYNHYITNYKPLVTLKSQMTGLDFVRKHLLMNSFLKKDYLDNLKQY